MRICCAAAPSLFNSRKLDLARISKLGQILPNAAIQMDCRTSILPNDVMQNLQKFCNMTKQKFIGNESGKKFD